MAERPRLKKSDEILGSIAAESARGKRAGGRMPDKKDEQARSEQNTGAKSVDGDFLEDDIELTDDPVLPSAQSLAEKLLPKKAPKQRDFGAYEPPSTPRQQASNAQHERAQNGRTQNERTQSERVRSGPKPPVAGQPQAKIEFDNVPVSEKTAAPAPVEFQAAATAAPAEIEFGIDIPVNYARSDRTQNERGQSGRVPMPPQQQRQSAQAARQPAPPPVQEFEAAPTISEYTFQSFEEPKATEDMSSVWEFSAKSEDTPRRERRERRPEEPQEPYQQAQSQPQPQPRPRRERIIQPLRKEAPSIPGYDPQPAPEQAAHTFETQPPQKASPPQPLPIPPQPPEQAPPPRLEMSETERNRQDFLNRIASQFEVQFEEKFEDGALRPRENIPGSEPAPSREPFAPQPLSQPPREPLFVPEPKPQAHTDVQTPVTRSGETDGEDFLSYVQRQERERLQKTGETAVRQAHPPALSPDESADEPALGFIEKFERDIREEEQQRSEDFKETLSQKFMRERERYLKELNISGEEPNLEDVTPEPGLAAPPVAPSRRKLDFQIQPEMHMQSGNLPPNPRPAGGMAVRPAGPVTYNRGGAARPQTPADDEDVVGGISVPEAAANGKKTGEQLLLEHSMRSRMPAMPKPQPAKLKFTFETPEEHAQKAKGEKESLLPTEKWPRRLVLIAMAAGLFALGLVIWSMVSYYNLSSGLTVGTDLPSQESPTVVEGTLDVYNDRVFTQTATVDSVLFKYAGALLKNVHVKDYVVIEDVEGTGRIRLEDANVDSAISVKSSGVDTLELHNVKAARLIINNPKTGMTVSVTGNTDIDIVELRTKTAVRQSDIGTDYTGISGMVVSAAEPDTEISAELDGLNNLRTLETSAANAVLVLAGNTRVETFSADGSLSLSGSGKIANLSIGAKVGQGAGDLEDRKDIILFVKDVSISSLNVKSPAYLNLSTTVDSISTADAVTIGGEASVGSLTLNPKAGSASRLLIDIVSANIQAVYSNTQSRINVTGSSRINELTADASTYILGNKVNHLRVNADNVIYENVPDKRTVANGVMQPQSKADNPNINYDLGATQQSVTDATGEDFATTCGHSRESGGFLLGDGSKDAPYEVSTAMQLAHAGSHLASHFIQTADLDISTESSLASNFPIIGGGGSPFEGVFDGKGFAVANLKIVSQAEYIGLFGANKGIVQNVRVYSGDISSASTSPGFVGGIAGINFDGGQIRSCSNGASVSGNQNVIAGGIAGGNYGGRIHDCYNYAKISGVDTVGGVTGLNRQGASVTGSYNAGIVDGSDEVGSVAGKNEDGTIANCYYLIDTTGYGIGSGSGTANERTAEELASLQMAADLSAGNENSLWVAGSSTGSYRYPVHRKPE